MSANSTSHSSRGRPIPLIPSSAVFALEPNTNPKALEEDSRRAELAQQFELLKQMVELEVADNAVQTCALPEVVVPVSPPKPTFLELAQNALELGRTPVVEARQASAPRVAEFQAVLENTLVKPSPRAIELPKPIDPAVLEHYRNFQPKPQEPEPERVQLPPTDPQIFWDMLANPKPRVEKVLPVLAQLRHLTGRAARVDLNALFPRRPKKFVPSDLKKPARKAVCSTPLEQEPVWESIPLELYTPFCVSFLDDSLEWCHDSELPIPLELDLPLEMYFASTLEPAHPAFEAKLIHLLQQYRTTTPVAPAGLEVEDSVVVHWVDHIREESQRTAFHWYCAIKKLEGIDLMLGHVRLLVRIIFTVSLSSGRKVFSLALWQLAEMIGVSADYIGELLVTYHDLLRRLFFFGEKFVTLEGKKFSQGYIWRVDLERTLDSDLMKMPLVSGNMKMFEVETRDLEADILAGYTAKGWQAKKQAQLPPGEKLGNRRGKVRNITSSQTLNNWEMLEGCCHRAAGVRPSLKEFQAKNSSSRYEIADAVNAPVGHTRGEHLGWVRRLGTSLAAFLGGAGDLKLWFKVGWTALTLEATNILADVINEVIIRNQDADQRNSSAIILTALFDRGLILQE
jgi:hypothetical protein